MCVCRGGGEGGGGGVGGFGSALVRTVNLMNSTVNSPHESMISRQIT